ncbi:hypothetical protein Y09_2204 [Brachybacterium sp. SW0106-09]|nr:hypothetical protein Y09_2204 [Brachybacterium sp. SW0106-09]
MRSRFGSLESCPGQGYAKSADPPDLRRSTGPASFPADQAWCTPAPRGDRVSHQDHASSFSGIRRID